MTEKPDIPLDKLITDEVLLALVKQNLKLVIQTKFGIDDSDDTGTARVEVFFEKK